MKILKITLFCIAASMLCYAAYEGSVGVMEGLNAQYEAENPVNSEEAAANPDMPTDIDKMMSHIVEGTDETILPIDYTQDYTIYENDFYVTVNQGQSWLLVPNDTDLGYARISEYIDTISRSNIYISDERVSIVYGGRGPENISIIATDSRGEVWSVGSISRTATHDLEQGYEKMYIDFIEGGKTGYMTAIWSEGTAQEEVFAFRSVNTGVTWDPVSAGDPLFDEVMAYFELQEMFYEQE